MRSRRNRTIVRLPKEKRWPPKLTDVLVIILAFLTLIVAIVTLCVAHYEGSTSDKQEREIDSLGAAIKKIDIEIDTLSAMSKNQQIAIRNQNNQLAELHAANTNLLTQGKEITKQTQALSLQLDISQKQQADNIKLAFLTKKMYVTRLMNTIDHMIHLDPNFDLEDYVRNTPKELAYLMGIKDLLEKEFNNQAILENTELSNKWMHSYDSIESAVLLLQYASRVKPLKDPDHPEDFPDEIKQRRFTSAYLDWNNNLGEILVIIKSGYKEFLTAKSH